MFKNSSPALFWLIILIGFIVSSCTSSSSTDTPIPIPSPTLQSHPTGTPEPTMTPDQPRSQSADANVIFVRAVQTSDNSWTFHVTVQHPDTGWEDYADGWDILTPDGMVLKTDPDSQFTRTLLHPHVNEQPFTRSQSGVEIPSGVTKLRVRAHDTVDGFGGREIVVDLTKQSGTDFEIETQS